MFWICSITGPFGETSWGWASIKPETTFDFLERYYFGGRAEAVAY